MTFDPTIPKALQLISSSQGPIQTNFNQSNIIMGVDHVNFDETLPAAGAAGNAGKHYQVRIIDQAGVPTTNATEIALHSLAGVLYFRKISNGTDIQMSGPDPVAGATGQTFLPGGLIMKWGTSAIGTGGGGTNVTFIGVGLTNFPTTCFKVFVTSWDGNAHYATVIPGTEAITGFNARADAAISINWLAIGN